MAHPFHDGSKRSSGFPDHLGGRGVGDALLRANARWMPALLRPSELLRQLEALKALTESMIEWLKSLESSPSYYHEHLDEYTYTVLKYLKTVMLSVKTMDHTNTFSSPDL